LKGQRLLTMIKTRDNMAKTSKTSKGLGKRGLIEDYMGKLILLVVFLIVVILIYSMLSGKFSQAGTGMQWLT